MSIFGFLLFATLLSQGTSGPDKEAELHRRFDHATQVMNAGAYNEAEVEFKNVLKEDPQNPSVLANLGVLYSKMHRYSEAIDADKQVLTRIPGQPAVELNLGLAFLKQQEYDQARPYFEDLHARSPDDQRLALLLATVLAYGKQPKEALPLLQGLVGGSQRNEAALYVLGIAYTRLGDTAQAHATFTQLFNSAKQAEIDFLIGEAYADATNYDDAKKAFEAALQNDPHFPGAQRELGRTLLGMHDNEKAQTVLEQAILADPKDASALYYLGALQVQLGQFKTGRAYLERARELAPDSWATYFYLGKAELELNELPTAERYLQEASEKNPDDYGAPYLLSRTLRREGKTKEAADALERVAKLHNTQLDVERRLKEQTVVELKPQDLTP